jgi:glycosyltransferase involved in cell wall biosynthesis
MRVVLFDWVHGGHHQLYLRRFAEALQPVADVVVAAPDEIVEQLDGLEVGAVRLGTARPPIIANRPLESRRRRVLEEEVRLLERVARDSRPDQMVHLYADPVLPHLVRKPLLPVPLSILLFYPRAHYPDAFQTRLGPGELVRARVRELVVAAWRRRGDAHALLTLDEEAARRWALRRGAPAYWVPEPPVSVPASEIVQDERSGCVVYGALDERKGIELLARAVAIEPTPVSITIAGEASTLFLPSLEAHVAEMRRSGATVDVRSYRHSETEGLRLLAQANCALLPYPRHDGMSRVLLEACTVGTPVVVHDRGLLGYLVRRHSLGRTVDCRDARELRRAILELAETGAGATYRASLAQFASCFSAERFRRAVAAPFEEAAAKGARSESEAVIRPGSARP